MNRSYCTHCCKIIFSLQSPFECEEFASKKRRKRKTPGVIAFWKNLGFKVTNVDDQINVEILSLTAAFNQNFRLHSQWFVIFVISKLFSRLQIHCNILAHWNARCSLSKQRLTKWGIWPYQISAPFPWGHDKALEANFYFQNFGYRMLVKTSFHERAYYTSNANFS